MKAFVVAATLLASSASTSATAQDAWKNDVFAGYSVLAPGGTGCDDCETDDGGSEILHGWHASVAWGFSGRLALVLDASGHQGGNDFGEDLDVLSLMAGPRLRLGNGRFRPFVHVLGGVVRSKIGIGIFEVDLSESSTGAGGAAGGGVDIAFGERWAVRAGADYRFARLAGETSSEPRFSAGVAYGFGTR